MRSSIIAPSSAAWLHSSMSWFWAASSSNRWRTNRNSVSVNFARNRFLQYLNKAHLFRCHFARRNFRPVQHRKAKLSEPCQRGVFDSGFGEFHAALIGSSFTLTDSGLTSVSPRA